MTPRSLFAPVRPVLSRDQATAIGRRIIELSSADIVEVTLTHHATGVSRVSPGRRCTSTDGDALNLSVQTQFGGKGTVWMGFNQLDDVSLKTAVQYAERIARARMKQAPLSGPEVGIGPRNYMPVELWHETSVDALADQRSVPILAILDETNRARLRSAVFVGASARSKCRMTKDGVTAYGEETDAELTVTCWTQDLVGSGWGGSAHRDWSKLDPMKAVSHAVDLARRSQTVQAVEPARRTAILGPAAVAQLVRLMTPGFDAWATIEQQNTPFSVPVKSSRVGQRVFDERVEMRSDPNDPEGGYMPFFVSGYPLVPMNWVQRGVLKALAYNEGYGAIMGMTPYADKPKSFRLSSNAKTAAIEEMIANCKEGIYVNRFTNVASQDPKSGMASGLTRDGCFLVRDGKLDRAVKNFRFLESPFQILNRVEMIGTTARSALGYTPGNEEWPLPPIIVPALMVRDFNFVALSDAV